MDKWIGDRQLAETKADIDARNHRRDLKGLLRDGEQLDIVDAAMAVYIDMKENSDSYSAENIQALTSAQQTLIEQAQSLSPDQQAFADQIIAENKALGIEAMEAGVIQNFKENYSARFWAKGLPCSPMMSRDMICESGRSPRRTVSRLSSVITSQ